MGRGIHMIALVIFLTACVSSPEPTTTPFLFERIATTTEMEGMVSTWLAAYVERTGQANLLLDVLSPQEILPSLDSGAIEAAFVAQEVPEGWFATPLVRVPIAVLVNPQVGVVSLEEKDLRGLFSGRMRSWENLTGNELPVQLVIPFPGNVIRERFAQQILDTSSFDPTARLGSTSEEILELISSEPGGIGFMLMEEPEENELVVAVGGIMPGKESRVRGRYPLWIDLLVISPEEPAGLLRDFVLWLQGSYLPEKGS